MSYKLKIEFTMFLIALLFAPGVAGAFSPALFLSSSNESFSKGQTFFIDIVVDTQEQDVNAVAAYISYPQDLVQPVSLTMEDFPMEIIIERNYGLGKIEVSGGTPTPGFNGIFTIATVKFLALDSGEVNISFLEGSAVLTDRGNKNIFEQGGNSTYEIVDVIRDQQEEHEELASSYEYAYESPVNTFLKHSLLSSLVGSGSLLNSFFSFISSLVQ